MQAQESLFCCPVCGGALCRDRQALVCAAGHSFDAAAQGYVNLLPANHRHSQAPGDDKGMVAARRAFLDAGWYAPFAAALSELACGCCAGVKAPVLLDAGCGEGYYTARLTAALGAGARVAAFDISKNAVRSAAGRYKGIEFAVASSFAMPLAAAAVDCAVNVFSPMAPAEFARVLRPGAALIYAVPSARHLFGLKKILYEQPYENAVEDVAYPGFALSRRVPVRGSITLNDAGMIAALFAMTPYYWKTPRGGAERLAAQTSLTTEIGFDFLVYLREG